MMIYSWEKRPLKRPRLGPPDVYPQDPKQREDELTAVNVKQGFSHTPQLSDEFGSAKNANISANKLGAFINGVNSKKSENASLPDTGKKRLQVNTKDHFWHVTPRMKSTLEVWMNDLAGGKQLAAIAKKVPIFNKREEIFLTLSEHQVPMVRATWFLKMTASYNSAMSEAKTKKRQIPDPSQEWTLALQRCCKDIFMRLTEWYNGGSGAGLITSINAVIPVGPGGLPVPGANLGPGLTPTMHQNPPSVPGSTTLNQPPGAPNTSTMNGTASNVPGQNSNPQSISPTANCEDGSGILKQWSYCIELAKFLYEEGLLDRYEWLVWIIDVCDKTKSIDDHAWKTLTPLLLSYLPDIAQSELLSRRIATSAAKKLSAMFTDQDFTLLSPLGGCPPSPPVGVTERLQCPTHRSTVFGLSSVIQVISLECPTSLVYNANLTALNNEGGRNSVPGGSALDILPIQPSILPMPPRSNNHIIRAQLREAENHIIARSRAVEAKWSCDEWQQSSAGTTLQKVLSVLDALDRHSFDKVEAGSSLETLYSKIFPNPPNKDNPVEADAPVVILLCQWAVCSQRTGEHRALAVARLLEQRQTETTTTNDGEPPILEGQIGLFENAEGSKNGSEGTPGEDTPMNGNESEGGNCDTNVGSNGSNNGGNGADSEDSEFGYSLPIYHNLLFKFLDADAPVLDETSVRSKTTFSSLVNLFGALIRHDVFSHDAYLCALVARGDLSTVPQSLSSASSMPPTSVQPINSVATPGPASQAGPNTPASVSSVTPGTTPHHDLVDERGPLFPPLPRLPETHRQTDYDDRNIDDDLDLILQRITQEQQNSMDQVDSPKDDTVVGGVTGFGSVTPNTHQQNATTPMVTDSSMSAIKSGVVGSNSTNSSTTFNSELTKQSRHRLFVTHFPLPQDDNFQHEINQRHILLYGCGRARDEARHMVKKVSKELGKLFSKKFCYDVSDGSRVKKQSKNEINFEQLQTRFAALPYFDQHAVTSTAGQTALEMLAAFATGRGNYLPTVEHIAYLTELMEASLHITGLIELSISMLRELPDIESQLSSRISPIASTYTTSVQLQLVAVLRRYHCSLLQFHLFWIYVFTCKVDTESTSAGWENLTRLMRRLSSNVECTSAERCTLAYLTELQACCGLLRSKNLTDYLTPTAAKLRQSLCSPVQPAESSHEWNNAFMTQCLDNPRRKVDNSIVRQLLENPGCRYSFVCNAILSICNEADAERLNDLASLCADMTAACPPLASEWLGVLQTLCSPSRHVVSYADILREVDIKHLSIHSSLATLTALLVARQCFSLQDFVMQAVPSLLKAWNEGRGPNDPDTEAGARLTCHLLLSLFKTQDCVTTVGNPSVLRLSCDRRLLSATHSSVTLGAVLAALKAMLLLADAASTGTGERRRDQRTLPGISAGELSISHILGTSDVPSERNSASDAIRGEPRTLASFAFSALHQMCGELWVRQRCLQNPDDLCNQEMLLDPIVSAKQAQRLLYMICYPELPVPEENLDARTHIPRILEGLNQWNIREAWLALTLQNKQLNSSPVEYQTWLDIVARAALEVFHLGHEDGQEFAIPNSAAPSPAPGKSPRSGKKTQQQSQEQIAKTPPSSFNVPNSQSIASAAGIGIAVNGIDGNKDNTNLDVDGMNANALGDYGSYGWVANAQWLIAPLVAKLSSFVQGRVLRHAGKSDLPPILYSETVSKCFFLQIIMIGNVLENTLWPKNYGKSKNSSGPLPPLNGVGSSSLHAHLPFLALVLTCLRGQDEQREGLLASLLNQFTQLLNYAKEREFDLRSDVLRDAIRLRLSLVGGMFDAVQRSSTATAEWAVVLTQLVTHGVVDINNNRDIIMEINFAFLLRFSDVFPTIVDMITALVHSTQIAEPGDRVEEMKRQNMNLVKKLKKELADRDSTSIKPLRQLLPFSKVQTDVLVTQATSMIIDSKGNRVPSFEFVDKKPGLQVWEKQRVSPWEIIECQRNPAPLSWAWFGAVKMERKNLRYEETHRLLKFHTHSLVKNSSHFLEPVPLPPEEIDPAPFPGPPMSNQMPSGPTQPPPNYPPGPPPPQWYNGQQPQQPFYTAQQVSSGGRPPNNQQSKQAIQHFLRARHTATAPPAPGASNQFQQFPQGPPTGPSGPPGPRHQNILRQQLRGQTPPAVPIQNQGFQGQPVMQPNQGVMFQQQSVPGQGNYMYGSEIYGYSQSSMGSQGQPVSAVLGHRSGGPVSGMMPPQQQQMNTMMGQRPPGFMQGNPQSGPTNSMNPMQAGYRRPQMGQMVQPGQLGGPGQIGPQSTGQMGQPVHGQMVQSMQNPGQMVQGGMGGPGMNNMVQQGQMGQPGMQNPGMRQFAMQQQQNHPQQQQGMGMGPRMHFQNQQAHVTGLFHALL
ncbi:Mediator of RNA polymerase II transcription subunit 12-like protein, partial [Orchesella cincta]